MDSPTEENWDIEITGKTSLFDLKLKGCLAISRSCCLLLVRRDFVAFYKQTILGPIWFFVQPIITILIYNLVFNNLAGIKTDVPAPLILPGRHHNLELLCRLPYKNINCF